MFTIIGGDGKEYGPVTTEQVRNWINTGRANLDTKAKGAGSDEWRRLGDFAEFGGISGVPPVIPSVVTGSVYAPASAPVLPASALALANLGERFGAAFIDGTIEALCWLPTSMAIMQSVREQMASGAPNFSEMMLTMNGSISKSLPYLGVLVIVQCVLLSIRGQSIGKLLVGLRIVRHPAGEPVGFLRAFFLRSLVPAVIAWIPLLGKLFWLVDVCFIFGEEHRCLHDLMAGTSVVKAKRN